MVDRRFRVLVVDNTPDVHEQADDELGSFPDVEVRHAYTADDATDLIRREFFDVAFVDLVLADASMGMAVVRALTAVSPACRIFVMSRRLHDDREVPVQALVAIGPEFTPAGVIDKTMGDEVEWFRIALQPIHDRWRGPHVAFDGIDEAASALADKRDRINDDLSDAEDLSRLRDDVEQIGHEVRHILLGMFGGMGPPGARSEVSLKLFRKGFSSSVALEAVPTIGLVGLDDPLAGNPCVVKLGPAPEILEEARRYEQVVRFGLRLDYRVELYSIVRGDAVAGVCYSFAGGGAPGIRSFDDLLIERSDGQWREVLRQIFDPDTGTWYSKASDAAPLRTYFGRERRTPLPQAFSSLDQWIESLVNRIPSAKRSTRGGVTRLRLAGVSLELPTQAMLALRGITAKTRGCLAHGDLHGGNIIVDSNGRPYFIDYQNAGVVPRCLDFAALHATMRFADVDERAAGNSSWRQPTEEAAAQIAGALDDERRLIAALDGREGGSRQPDWWIEACRQLDRHLMDNFDDASKAEILWTYWAYSLSMFRFVKMDWYKKFRILIWLSALTSELSK